MNYKLAKQLKDAGFPQPPYDGVVIQERNTGFPTLSELIDSCGEIRNMEKQEKGWLVNTRKEFAFEKTLEEAVAKLWIKLNK